MGMNFAYFDCFAGLSGDMILGALFDLGLPEEFIEENIRNMPLDAFHKTIEFSNIRTGQPLHDAVQQDGRRKDRDIPGKPHLTGKLLAVFDVDAIEQFRTLCFKLEILFLKFFVALTGLNHRDKCLLSLIVLSLIRLENSTLAIVKLFMTR